MNQKGGAIRLSPKISSILKPASDTALVAYLLCQCFWRAGVPREALQFTPCEGRTVGAQLACHSQVDSVILTGGTATARSLLEAKPDLNLLAETGGKNATIVTSMSDRDLAISHVLQSAFGHSGQKCSATSLLILEEEIYNDERFKRTLCDAVRSLPVGSAWELHNIMGPLIRPPEGDLDQGIKELETGESWAVMPTKLENNPNLYSPGVKWNVQPDSFTHMTELFGPVLGVMKARDLDHAIDLVNHTGFGLTSGLESLDDREQEYWKAHIRAGNLYINRLTTGAVVLRQPFGGMGKSAFGPGIKAGGPNYVAQLMTFTQTAFAQGNEEFSNAQLKELYQQLNADADEMINRINVEERQQIRQALRSYDLAYVQEFSKVHDDCLLLGQDNQRRYLPVAELRVRVHKKDSAVDIFSRAAAAIAVGSRVTMSYPKGLNSTALAVLEYATDTWGGRIEFIEESDEELIAVINTRHTDRLRYADPGRVPEAVLRAVGNSGIYVASMPVVAEGRVELLWYLREQSISFDYHRYGTLADRADEQRAPTC